MLDRDSQRRDRDIRCCCAECGRSPTTASGRRQPSLACVHAAASGFARGHGSSCLFCDSPPMPPVPAPPATSGYLWWSCYFRQHHFGHPPVNPGNRIQFLQRGLLRARHGRDPLVETHHQLLRRQQLLPQHAQQPAMMVAHSAVQRLLELVTLVAQLSACQGGQLLRIALSRDDRLQH